MTDLIEFFLKTEAGPDTPVAPPYLLHFQMHPDNVPLALSRAQVLLPMLIEQGGLADEREAAEAAIADALVNESHLDPRLQQMICFLLAFLIASSEEGRAAIGRGAEKIGLLFRPGLEARLKAVRRAAAASEGGAVGVLPVHGVKHSFRLRIVG